MSFKCRRRYRIPYTSQLFFSLSYGRLNWVRVAPGDEDDVVDDEIFKLFPIDELLVEALPLVLGRGDVCKS